jgi:hypothetical protein
MLIYRSADRPDEAGRLIDVLHDRLSNACHRGVLAADDATDILLGSAELETAVADALSREHERDDMDVVSTTLRRLTRRAASLVVDRWYGHAPRASCALATMGDTLRSIADQVRRMPVVRRIPEGYAHYAVYPGTYIDATERFVESCAPDAATVIGVRTIGTSLASVVAATLAAHGVDVVDTTVRPRGHPFDRCIALGPSLTAALRDRVHGWFVIVDEGPGLSGSSFAAVADALSALGAPDDRVVFMPSWMPAAESLRNERARDRWRRHLKFIGDFDRAWIASGRLARQWGGRIVGDWCAGQWRDVLAPTDVARPAVHPQHEQRKYLLDRPDGTRLVLKFNGLGPYGRSRTSVARRMAASGWSPEVLGVRDGFMAMAFASGAFVRPGALTGRELVQIGRYIAARPRARHDDSGATTEDLASMIDTNVRELCGERWAGMAAVLARTPERASTRTVAIDGRMQAHEWLRSADGTLLKVDGAAHHDDHFFPGCVDVAWDVVGACVELCQRDDERTLLVDAFISASGDRDVRHRLPYWTLAYSAFRAGYSRVASESLGNSADGRGMAALAERYTSEIHRVLTA